MNNTKYYNGSTRLISAIIVVVEKDKKYLNNCLISLEKSAHHANTSLEIIIVANATTISPPNYIKSNCKIINNRINLGFGKAINQGVKRAEGKWCILLNPDTITQKNTIKQLSIHTNINNLAIISPRILKINGELEYNLLPLTSHWTIFLEQTYLYKTGISLLRLPNSNLHVYSSTHIVDAVTATYWLINKKILLSIGGFDERFYLYFEDIDFCNRVKNSGYKILFVHKATVKHFGQQSNSGILRADLFLDGLTKYLLKYHSFFYSRIAFLLLFLGSISRILYWNSKLLLSYNINVKSLAKKKITFYNGVFIGSFNYLFLKGYIANN